MNRALKTPSPARSHSRSCNSSPRFGSSGRSRRRRRTRMLRMRRTRLWANSARQAAIATQPRLTRAPTAEPWRSKERHSRASAPGVSGSMWMSSMASSSSLMTICCSQPWELIILSIAGGVAAGAPALLAGATDSNKHKNNTRPSIPPAKRRGPVHRPWLSACRSPASHGYFRPMAGDPLCLFLARSCVSGSQRLAQGGRRLSSGVNGASLRCLQLPHGIVRLLPNMSVNTRARRDGASTPWDIDIEERAVLLAAKDIGIAGAAARNPAVDRELDRQCRVEFDVVGYLRRVDAEDPADRFTRQDATLANVVIGDAVGEDHVETDLVDAGVLAADRLRNFRQFAGRRQIPASTIKVGNSSSGSSSRIVWFTVQR